MSRISKPVISVIYTRLTLYIAVFAHKVVHSLVLSTSESCRKAQTGDITTCFKMGDVYHSLGDMQPTSVSSTLLNEREGGREGGHTYQVQFSL